MIQNDMCQDQVST